tara:strand:- start:1087 stop:1554 length:468 start_codon:yes stop_codon:yes gene_type:complete
MENVNNSGGGNSTKTLIITVFSLAGAVALFFMGRSIYKGLNKDESGSGGSSSGGSGSSGNTGSANNSGSSTPAVLEPLQPTYNPNQDAAALHKTMDGGGTNDDDFWRITNRLNGEQKIAVKARFTQMYGSLKDWIEGDFSFSAEDRALKAWGYPA